MFENTKPIHPLTSVSEAEEEPVLLELHQISKTFLAGSVNARKALDDINFRLRSGEFTTIIGSNGAGKSTLLNLIAGVHKADRGSMTIDGKDIGKLPEYRRASLMGRVFQNTSLGTAAGMSLWENLALASRRGKHLRLRWGLPNGDREVYRSLLRELNLGLEDRLDTKVGLLSGGQRQAVTLLMAIIKAPRLLLLDEHTAALDPPTSEKVLELTGKMIEDSELATLMVTHNMRHAIQYGNRLIMMDEGRIVVDVRGGEKARLTVPRLLELFREASSSELNSDRALLSQ